MGGFRVDDGHGQRLERHARQLGFHDLRGLLQARCDSGHSIPGLARELGVSQWTITKAIATLGIVLPPRRQQLARQRRHHANQQITARVSELGFHDLHGYLTDRLFHRQWPQAAVASELGTHLARVRDLLGQVGVRREGPTARQRAVAQRARQVQAAVWQARRAARLAELGFPDLPAYLHSRVGQGWSIRRMRAELAVARSWLVAEMVRLGYRQ